MRFVSLLLLGLFGLACSDFGSESADHEDSLQILPVTDVCSEPVFSEDRAFVFLERCEGGVGNYNRSIVRMDGETGSITQVMSAIPNPSLEPSISHLGIRRDRFFYAAESNLPNRYKVHVHNIALNEHEAFVLEGDHGYATKVLHVDLVGEHLVVFAWFEVEEGWGQNGELRIGATKLHSSQPLQWRSLGFEPVEYVGGINVVPAGTHTAYVEAYDNSYPYGGSTVEAQRLFRIDLEEGAAPATTQVLMNIPERLSAAEGSDLIFQIGAGMERMRLGSPVESTGFVAANAMIIDTDRPGLNTWIAARDRSSSDPSTRHVMRIDANGEHEIFQTNNEVHIWRAGEHVLIGVRGQEANLWNFWTFPIDGSESPSLLRTESRLHNINGSKLLLTTQNITESIDLATRSVLRATFTEPPSNGALKLDGTGNRFFALKSGFPTCGLSSDAALSELQNDIYVGITNDPNSWTEFFPFGTNALQVQEPCTHDSAIPVFGEERLRTVRWIGPT